MTIQSARIQEYNRLVELYKNKQTECIRQLSSRKPEAEKKDFIDDEGAAAERKIEIKLNFMGEACGKKRGKRIGWAPGARFSKAPESFRARNANFKSPQLKNQNDSSIRNAA